MTRTLGAALLLFTAGFLAPEAARADVREGVRLANEGKSDQALQKFRDAAAKNPSDAGAHLALGMVALDKGLETEAQAALETAARLDPASAAAHYGLALLYEKNDAREKARSAWEKVVALSKDPSMKEMAQRHLRRLAP